MPGRRASRSHLPLLVMPQRCSVLQALESPRVSKYCEMRERIQKRHFKTKQYPIKIKIKNQNLVAGAAVAAGRSGPLLGRTDRLHTLRTTVVVVGSLSVSRYLRGARPRPRLSPANPCVVLLLSSNRPRLPIAIDSRKQNKER